MSERRQYDTDQDRTVEESFPASDPPARTPARGPGRVSGGKEETEPGGEEHLPKGKPTDDRLASETASARTQGIDPPETDHR